MLRSKLPIERQPRLNTLAETHKINLANQHFPDFPRSPECSILSLMKSSTSPRNLILLASFALAPLTVAYAGDEDNLNEKIAASACQPQLSSDRSKLEWTNQDWAFASGQTGTIVLECPVFTDYVDDDTGTRELEELRLWYRDSDGTGTHARIQASLRERLGSSTTLGSVDSNGSATTTSTTRATSLGSGLMSYNQYYVLVTMFRDDDTKTVLFRGISFFEEP